MREIKIGFDNWRKHILRKDFQKLRYLNEGIDRNNNILFYVQ